MPVGLLDNAKLKERDDTIETLTSRLEEITDQMHIAKQDVESHKFENEKLRRESSLQGETYESIGEQLRAMANERLELSKQLNASKGRAALANDTVSRLQRLLDEEKETNALLRKRQGYVALQEEKKAALELLEQERKSANDREESHKKTKGELVQQVDFLLKRAKELEATVESAQKTTDMVLEEAEAERRARVEAEEKARGLQETVQQMDGVLASVQEAASRNKPKPLEHRTTDDSGFQDDELGPLPRGQTFRSISDTFIVGAVDNGAAAEPVQPSNGSPVGHFRGAADALKRRQTEGSIPTTNSSPTSPSVGGFRTIHGQHRMDGSLGGYRTNRRKKQTTSDSLYSVSNHSGEDGSVHSPNDA